MLPKKTLEKLYGKGLSMKEISDKTNWSYKQVVYWMGKHNIPRRSWSEATYVKRNPAGDPFHIKENLNRKESELKGFGLGLFWGEGCKTSKHSVRLGNTDYRIIKKFIEFLVEICGVKRRKIKYGLQLFNDSSLENAVNFWKERLDIADEQIGKVSIMPSRGVGTYKRKNKYGVLTVHVHNMKFKEEIDRLISQA